MEDFYRIRRLPPYVFEEVNKAKARRAQWRRRHHRPRHGQSRPAGAGACHREAEGDDRQAAHRPLFGLARHSGPAPRAGRLLRAPLRREAQSRHAGRRHARLEGGLRQCGAGDHRAGRRRARAQPELSDPRFRLPDGGRRDPLGAGRSRRRTFSTRSSARSMHSIPKPIAVVVCYPANPTAYVADLDFYKDLVAFAKKHEHPDPVRSRLCRGLFRRQPAAVGAAGAGRDRRRGRIHLDVEDLFDAGLAHRLRGRQRAHHRGAGAGEILSRLRRLHAGPGGGDRRAQWAGRLHPARCATTYRKRRDVLVDSFGRAGWHVPAPRASMFAWAPIPEPFQTARQRRILQAAGREGRASRSRPASASANMAKAMCASRWWRTSSASARPPATSAASLKPARKRCTTSFLSRTRR